MARYRGPRLKVIRRIGENIPGLMCIDQKNIEKQYPPGEHGQIRKGKLSDYQLHLKEKQKIRYHYGILERQLKRYSKIAFKSKDNTGLSLLIILEKRIDNIIYRAGFFRSIRAARQAVVHGHILINKKKNNIPSYIIKINDIIEFCNHSKIKKQILLNTASKHTISVPNYINIDKNNKSISVISEPIRKDIPININEQLVIEYYSGR
jgi:small subunit ribosomal protein S4